jgi:hypothetical protein
MPKAELQALYKKEKEQAGRDQQANLLLEEQLRFYNRASAIADFEHWSKATYWTLDEAVALSLGKAPEVVNWASIEPYTETSPFATNYARIRDLVSRARAWQQLSDPVHPGSFLAWAKRNGIPYPPELEEQVSARGKLIADWKTLYDQQKVQYEEKTTALKQQIADWRALCERKQADFKEHIAAADAHITEQHTRIAESHEAIAKLVEERDQLHERLVHIEKTQTAAAKEKPLLTKERETVLKMIITMAKEKYGYDPQATRNEATAEIVSDLELLGFSLDADTVRRWLKEGAERLPAEARIRWNR